MMSHHIMIVLIVTVAVIGSVLRSRYKAQAAERKKMARPDTERLQQEVKALRERLATLERITIEKESSLEREIEQLRDR